MFWRWSRNVHGDFNEARADSPGRFKAAGTYRAELERLQ